MRIVAGRDCSSHVFEESTSSLHTHLVGKTNITVGASRLGDCFGVAHGHLRH